MFWIGFTVGAVAYVPVFFVAYKIMKKGGYWDE